MGIQRRFEIYKVRDDVSAGTLRHFEGILRNTPKFIPEVLHSIVARNLSKTPLNVVWEHAYTSEAAYDRYMVHPYHANILDRFLLHDNPERITKNNSVGAGLVGYDIATPDFYMARGVRRLVLLGLRPDASTSEKRDLEAALRAAPKESPEMTMSVVGYNSMGSAWRPSRWAYLWEQGFKDLSGLEAYRKGGSALARAERARWKGFMNGLVVDSVDFYYKVHRPVEPPGKRT